MCFLSINDDDDGDGGGGDDDVAGTLLRVLHTIVAKFSHPHPPYNGDNGDHHDDNYPQNIGDSFITIINAMQSRSHFVAVVPVTVVTASGGCV